MTDSRLEEIVRELRETTDQLRGARDDPDRAGALSERCAELASQAAAELDRVARAAPADSVPGQEELL